MVEAFFDADADGEAMDMEPYVAALQQSHANLLRALVKRAKEDDRALVERMNADRIVFEATYEDQYSEAAARAHTFSIRPWGKDHVQRA